MNRSKLIPSLACALLVLSIPTTDYGEANGSIAGIDPLSVLIPEHEREVIDLSDMSERQRNALSTLLIGFYLSGLRDAVLESNIDGEFEGWDGETIVKLTDGSVFEQSEFHFEWRWAYRPSVELFVSPMSLLEPFTCQMFVEGTRKKIEVERIKEPRVSTHARLELIRNLLEHLPENAQRRAFIM